MEHENLKIISLKEALKLNLSIPNYQRPYRWGTESASLLFSNIYSAYKSNIPEYRIGSIVLHNNNNELEIVDSPFIVWFYGLIIQLHDFLFCCFFPAIS